MLHDEGGACVPTTPNTTPGDATATPTVALKGLGVLAVIVVAPASVCIAPSETSSTTAAFRNELIGEAARISPRNAATLGAGVRCRIRIRTEAWKFIHGIRRLKP